MIQDYKQYYTSSLFNIKNNIDFSQKTTFINVFTNEDLKIFNKINDKIVIYNNEFHFFNYLNNINKVIQSNIKIYSDNTKIREYLLKNRCNPKFIDKDKYESTIIINSYSPTETDLTNSIDSCLKQENVIIKIIIVTIEDDITNEIIKKNYSSNNNITVIVVKKNDHPGKGPKGIYYQLNQAYSKINTRFVSYFSSNDIMYSTKIINEINCLLNNKAIFCFSKYISIFPDTNEKQTYNYKNIMNYENLLKGNYINDCATIDISKLDKKIEFNYEKYGNTCYWHLWLSLLQKYGEKYMCYNDNIEWEYIRDKTKSQSINRQKSINKTELYYNQIEFMLSEFKNNIKPNSVYKYNLCNQKFWWWNDITNKKKVELTVALPALNADKIIWLALESLKNQININFAWELIVFEEEGVSKKIVQSYQGLLPGCVRIIYKTITKDDAFYKIEDIQENKCTSYYTLLEKWINIAKISDKNSKIFVKHAVDCYSSPKRLYIHYEHFKNDMCYYSTQPKGYFYNIKTDQWLLYDGYKLEPISFTDNNKWIRLSIKNINNPNIIIRGCHLNMALRTNIMKMISFSEKPKRSGLDAYILNNISKIINIRTDQKKIIFLDDEIDTNNWKYSLDTDGYNNISSRQSNYYNKDKVNKNNWYIPFEYKPENNTPEYIIDRLKNINKKKCNQFLNINENYFNNKLINSLKLINYNNNTKPIIIWGGNMRNLDNNIIKMHKSNIIIIWTGTDAYYEINMETEIVKNFINKNFDKQKIIHIAMSNSIYIRLKHLFPNYIIIKKTISFIDNYNDYEITKKGDSVYVYLGISTYRKQIVYGYQLIKQIILSNPNITFYISTNKNDYELYMKNPKLNIDVYNFLKNKNVIFNSYSNKDLINIYKKCFIGLRLTNNDGNANTIQELGLMGIRCIHIDNIFPNVITYDKEDKIWDINISENERINICKKYYENINSLINKEKKEINNINYNIRNKMINFINLNKGSIYI